MTIIKTPAEIEAVYDEARDGEINGTKFPGMSYEEGIVALIDWLTGRSDTNPLED